MYQGWRRDLLLRLTLSSYTALSYQILELPELMVNASITRTQQREIPVIFI